MEALEKRILSEGEIRPGGILKVDGFLNHRIDPQLSYDMAVELKRLYEGTEINKVLTIEASGIAMACMVAYVLGCPLVFAKKSKTSAKIKGLKKKTIYYVRVRYYDGTGYSAWSKVKKVKTK